ncbi:MULTISPECIES: oligosaccharide flippase family protein [unclassified Microbacterium]|uniref:lipopolysaccharide biosynthesis protein n=1 Tax=unclassified Microbacterium TaxID=2609290 RepID=UPI00214B9DAD|nr:MULTISPECIES: oligosaccharide flippase family protein [unclassified Microbacterium]MCR2808903.1 oligosaccharide flippase family protein [Microbacterium sp. zg.B185]WIM18678.1 oligosaccharide flippase family protein [Microbacterium sp. zg-B185]
MPRKRWLEARSPAVRDFARSGGSRVLTLLLSLVLVTYSTRLIISYLGTESYGYIALVASLAALLAFSDLGIGTAVTTEIARLGFESARVQGLIARVVRALTGVSIVIVILAVVTWIFDLWPIIFADPQLPTYITTAASVSLVFFAVSVRAGIGYRVLIGINRSHLAIYCQLLGPIIATMVCFSAVALDGPAFYLAIAVPLGSMVAAVATLIVAMRTTGLNLLAPRYKGYIAQEDRLSIAKYSVPAFAVLVASPLIFQSDRLLLAWFSTPAALAQYSVLAQLYGPAVSVANAIALPLWSKYSASEGAADLSSRFPRHVLLLGGVGVVLGVSLVAVAPLYAVVVSAGALGDLTLLASSFALLIVAQSLQLPAGMYLTSPKGFRALSLLFAIAVLLKLALSVLFVPALSAAGPVLASVAAVLFAITVPSLLIAGRWMKRGAV